MMSKLLFELPLDSAERFGDRPCLTLKGRTVDYTLLATQIERFEYQLWIYRNWAVFENVSLVPARKTNVGLKVEGAFGSE